jgi:hypothetical protein
MFPLSPALMLTRMMLAVARLLGLLDEVCDALEETRQPFPTLNVGLAHYQPWPKPVPRNWLPGSTRLPHAITARPAAQGGIQMRQPE